MLFMNGPGTYKHIVARDYVRLLKYGDSFYRCKQLKRAALRRIANIMKRLTYTISLIERTPCITEAALKNKSEMTTENGSDEDLDDEMAKLKKKTERDIELEMGDDYILDLKKRYDIEGDRRFDIIPEI
uniref:Uncharacterized protein n=1 Tax=Tetranychus urticae TaxID=32264 RepID=T1JUS1_TETUR